MTTSLPAFNTGANLDVFLNQKHSGHLNLNDSTHPLNIIALNNLNNNSMTQSIIKLMGQYIKPTKLSFLGKTIIFQPALGEKVIQYPNQTNLLKKSGINNKSNLFDISILYNALITSFHSVSKNKVIDSLFELINSINEDFKIKAPGRETIFLFTEDSSIFNQDHTIPTKINSIIGLINYMIKFNIPFNTNLDGIVFLDEKTHKFYPLTIKKEKNSIGLKWNKNTFNQLLMDLDIKTEINQSKIELTDDVIINDKQEVQKLLSEYEKLEKSGEAEKTSEKEQFLNQVKTIIDKYPGKDFKEKLTYLFKIENKNKNSEVDLKPKKQEPLAETKTKTETKTLETLEEINRIYNGSVLFSEIEPNLTTQIFQPKTTVGLKEFSSINKQRTEMFEKLDENISDLMETFKQDPDLKIEVLDIKSKLVETNKDRFIEYTVKIKHDYGMATKKPYSITFRVPAPIDDKYVKIGGNNYIMIQQLFPQPIQKVNNTTARLYTHYNTTSVILKGSKLESKDFTTIEKEFMDYLQSKLWISKSDIEEVDSKTKEILLEYHCDISSSFLQYNFKIKNKITKSIINIDFSNVETKDNEKIIKFLENISDDKKTILEFAYISKETNEIIYYENGNYHVYPKNKLNEFLINYYNQLSKKYFEIDILKKSKSSLPYFSIKLSGINIPVINYNLLLRSWKDTFDFLGIKYTIDTKKIAMEDNESSINYSLQFADKTIINMYPTTLMDQYLINGLFQKKNQIKNIKFDENSTTLLDELYKVEEGDYKLESLKLSKYKIIDKTSSKLLLELGYSDDILVLYSKTMPGMILDRTKKANLDISNFRLRMSEVVSHFMYNQIQQSISYFKKRSTGNSNAKIEIDKNFIISNLQSAGILQYTKSMNPLEELLISTKVSKTGVGNTTKQQVTLERRDLNNSYFGTISPTTTNEYSGIGSNQTLTLGSQIKDKFGNINLKEFDNSSNPFENISIAEALNPFMEYNDTTRAIMGNQQTSQFVELQNPDEPLVQTGFEAIVPHLVSSRFSKKSKEDGKVTKITNNTITIKYNSGTTDNIDIGMLKTRTKRGIYVPSEYVSLVTVGQKVNKGQIVATTSSMKSGKLAMGKNLIVAELPYFGMNYEDGWVISEKIKEKYSSQILKKISIRIPPNCNIVDFNLDGFVNKHQLETDTGTLLIEFQKENYRVDLDVGGDEDSEDDVLTGLIQKDKTIRYYSPGGTIKDIVVKINSLVGLPKEVINLHKLLSAPLQEKLDFCKMKSLELNDQVKCLGHIENLDMLNIGGHKINNVEFDGALIECYILTDNPVTQGSKFVLSNSGGKGTVQYIIPKDKAPVAMETGLEIEFIGTPLSIIGRKSPNIIYNMYLGKIMYFLNKQAKELAANGKFVGIKKLVTEVYQVLDNTKDHMILNDLKLFFEKDAKQVLRFILNSDPLNRPAFPAIMPPFKNKLEISNLEQAAKILNIPLNEKVYIKEHDIITEKEVVVGILPIYMLEHFPKGMGSVRGSINIMDQFVSGQGRSGSKEGLGAIKVGLYDMYSILSKNGGEGKELGHLLKELHSIKSDATLSKRKYINSLIYKNELPSIDLISETDPQDTKTKTWIEAMFYGCGLQPDF